VTRAHDDRGREDRRKRSELSQDRDQERAAARSDARSLRLRARRDVSTSIAGAYRSAFRGRGLTFEELRDYNPGDDVRSIEWNATARLGRPISKRMREERDLIVCLLVDLSASLDFGYAGGTKLASARRAAAALATAALWANDRVALASFADGIVDTLSPSAGPLQLERVLQCIGASPASTHTRPGPALDWAVNRLPRHTVTIWISDLLFEDPGAPLRQCARKHELVALRLADPADRLPARSAPVRTRGAESGHSGLLRTRRRNPSEIGAPLDPSLLRSLGVDLGTIWTGARLIPSLQRFFEARSAGTSHG
jgi:uncharacterized protein (DUF58 family)